MHSTTRRLSLAVLTLLIPNASAAQVVVYQDRAAFEAATGAQEVAIPPSDTFSGGPGFLDLGCTDNLAGIGLPLGAPLVNVTAPLAIDFICIAGPDYNAGSANIDPQPVGPTLIANGEDDYVLAFSEPIYALGLELLTNFTAVEQVVLDLADSSQEVIADGALGTDPNAFEFVGFASATPITQVHLDTASGGFQNEGIAAILVALCDATALAVETPRLGAPPNPFALLPSVSSPPVIGAVWDPVIDHGTFAPNAVADFMIVSGGATNLPLGNGTLLCDPTQSPFFLISNGGAPGDPFQIAVPKNCGLVGFDVCAQGGSILPDNTTPLANALDITIGTP